MDGSSLSDVLERVGKAHIERVADEMERIMPKGAVGGRRPASNDRGVLYQRSGRLLKSAHGKAESKDEAVQEGDVFVVRRTLEIPYRNSAWQDEDKSPVYPTIAVAHSNVIDKVEQELEQELEQFVTQFLEEL